MVQEDQAAALASKVAALDRRVKDLERLLTLGLVGGDAEATLQQHTALLGRLVGDQTLGNLLLGPFPASSSSQVFRRRDGSFYKAATLGSVVDDTVTLFASANILFAVPFYAADRPTYIDKLRIDVTSAAAGGSKARVAVYLDDGSVYPGKLVGQDQIAIDATGLVEADIQETVPRGLLWLAYDGDTTATIRGIDSDTLGAWNIMGFASGGTAARLAWRAVDVTGVLPDVYPAGATSGVEGPAISASFKAGGWS